GVFILCFIRLNKSYDPLSRYPYVNDQNKEVILEHMSQEDIDYMVNQHIKPEEFMDFIDVEGFDIHQTRSYKIAKDTQDADNEYIVNFVNKYHSHFRRDELATLLSHYSYMDLTTFYENEQVLNENIRLVVDPSDGRVVLGEDDSVYKYIPDQIIQWNEIFIKDSLKASLEEMQTDYATELSGMSLRFVQGYTTYDTLSQTYAEKQAQYAEHTDLLYRNGGQSEFQLGMSVATENAQIWNDACMMHIDEVGNIDYSAVEATLTEQQRNQIVWLEENAYHYGFIIRYPFGQEERTDQAYQPFVLRYVGKKQAKKMKKNNQVLEQADRKGWKV
ncbi:MAG: D-alanyl-D-alanine carboxypeptidase family protein, partial [Erysipelotrichaceae bacterium]|nr:D-alanyl-D-alanine carboxypeptidase family protein [Erysipelotrichaceae bacterium]